MGEDLIGIRWFSIAVLRPFEGDVMDKDVVVVHMYQRLLTKHVDEGGWMNQDGSMDIIIYHWLLSTKSYIFIFRLIWLEN
jgi:hypothetical protein